MKVCVHPWNLKNGICTTKYQFHFSKLTALLRSIYQRFKKILSWLLIGISNKHYIKHFLKNSFLILRSRNNHAVDKLGTASVWSCSLRRDNYRGALMPIACRRLPLSAMKDSALTPSLNDLAALTSPRWRRLRNGCVRYASEHHSIIRKWLAGLVASA
jgi:hypothetical protein